MVTRGLLHVIDRDVITEHRAGVPVLAAHRSAGKGDKGGIGERIAKVLGVTDLVGFTARLALQLGLKAILGAMGFIGDDDNVVPAGKHREGILVFARHELLDGGKDNAARRPIGELGPQILSGADLGTIYYLFLRYGGWNLGKGPRRCQQGFAYTHGTRFAHVRSRRPVEADKARHASPRVDGERLQARATIRLQANRFSGQRS